MSSVVAFIVVLFLVLLALFLYRRRKAKKQDPESIPMTTEPKKTETIKAISDITIKERIGGGNFGDVYRGLWNVTSYIFLMFLKK